MRQRLGKAFIIVALAFMVTLPCAATTQAAVQPTQIVTMTETKSTSGSYLLKLLKYKIASLLGINIGDVGDINVSTKDDVNVKVDDNNIVINININLNLLNLIFGKK